MINSNITYLWPIKDTKSSEMRDICYHKSYNIGKLRDRVNVRIRARAGRI